MSSQLPLSCWLAVTQDPHKDQEAQTQLCSDSLFLETWLCQGDGHLLWPSSLTAPLQRKTQPALNLIFIHFTRNWCDEEFNVRLLKTLYLALESISLLFFFFFPVPCPWLCFNHNRWISPQSSMMSAVSFLHSFSWIVKPCWKKVAGFLSLGFCKS